MVEHSVGPARRWVADPLVLLGATGTATIALVLVLLAGGDLPWQPPAMLGVVAAGLALSGST